MAASRAATEAELLRLRVQLGGTFSPSAPVGSIDLFAGRMAEIRQSVSAVSQQGQHVILFGERGVGKTSLAGLVNQFWSNFARDRTSVFPVRYNCDRTDTYGSIWSHIAQSISDRFETTEEGRPRSELWAELYTELTEEGSSPHTVRRFLDIANKTFIIVIDEFDQIEDKDTIRLFASTIKNMSDNLSASTLILVGVADTVDELMEDHASVDRALVQILLPRMLETELTEIIRKAYDSIALDYEQSVIEHMGHLAQGLPHYAHRFGLEAGLAAVDRENFKGRKARCRYSDSQSNQSNQ